MGQFLSRNMELRLTIGNGFVILGVQALHIGLRPLKRQPIQHRIMWAAHTNRCIAPADIALLPTLKN